VDIPATKQPGAVTTQQTEENPMSGDEEPAASEPGPPRARPRARQLGIALGRLQPGPHNAITDVGEVRVGHATLFADRSKPQGSTVAVRTGVTVVLPHAGNLFRDKVVGAVEVINGFGKAVGTTQVQELGLIESPIALTNTFGVGAAFEALLTHALGHNPEIGKTAGTVNPLIGECNDGYLNDLRGRHVKPRHVLSAIRAARPGAIEIGAVGAGGGMVCYGWKGGVGTASRAVPDDLGGFRVGALVVTNFGHPSDLVIDGVKIGSVLTPGRSRGDAALRPRSGGSVVTVLATDAPVSSLQLGRMARRVKAGLARTGSFGEHYSGEYVFAFSTAQTVPHWPGRPAAESVGVVQDEAMIDALFEATCEATEEAVVDSLFVASTVRGEAGRVCPALPAEEVRQLIST
jgi:D-aminopeptidase